MHKSSIAYGGIIITIAYVWSLESQVRPLEPLFLGGRLNLAFCIQMNIFKLEGGLVFTNHHGRPLFPLLNSTKTTCIDPFN